MLEQITSQVLRKQGGVNAFLTLFQKKLFFLGTRASCREKRSNQRKLGERSKKSQTVTATQKFIGQYSICRGQILVQSFIYCVQYFRFPTFRLA